MDTLSAELRENSGRSVTGRFYRDLSLNGPNPPAISEEQAISAK